MPRRFGGAAVVHQQPPAPARLPAVAAADAHSAVFIASDAAGAFPGQDIKTAGGYVMW